MRLSLINDVRALAVCGCILHVSAVLAVEIITTADGVHGADAFVRFGTPTQNYGNTADIVVKDAPPSQNPSSTTRKAWVRFDLSRLGAARAAGASLDLTVRTNNGGGSSTTPANFTVCVFGLADGDAGENWVEGNGAADNQPAGEIVWNNGPANDTTSATGMLANASLLGTFNVTDNDAPGSTVTFSGPALASFINDDSDGIATLVLTRISTNGGNNLVFESKESGRTPPTLRISTYSDYLTPDADAYVQKGAPDQNFGADGNVTIKDSGTGTTTRKGYLKYNVSALDIGAVGDAELILDVSVNNAGGGDTDTAQNYTVRVWGLKDSVGADDWVEGNNGTDGLPAGEITWANAPANDTAGNDTTGDGTLLFTDYITTLDSNNHTVAFGAGETGFTDFLKTDSDGWVTLILQRVGGGGSANLAFASKEHATLDPPVLRVRIVPAPATVMILVAGAGGLLLSAVGQRRRLPVSEREEGRRHA